MAEEAITSFTFIPALFLSWERGLWEDPHRGSYPLSIAASSVLLLRQFPEQDLERADHEETAFPQVGARAKCSRLTSAEQGGSDKSTLIMERLRRMWFHKNQECLGSVRKKQCARKPRASALHEICKDEEKRKRLALTRRKAIPHKI